MFTASATFGLFDYLRVPYRIAPANGHDPAPPGWGWMATSSGGPRLLWPVARSAAPRGTFGAYRVDGRRIFGHVVTDDRRPEWLRDDRRWRAEAAVTDVEGRAVSAVRVDPTGTVVLPFDPAEVMATYWSEGYQRAGSSVRATAQRLALRGYYAIRPALPRPLQIAMRRTFSRFQGTPSFPGWPVETGLMDFLDWSVARLARFAGRPVPWIAPWPGGASWSLVLTHDVETSLGVQRIGALRDIERQAGLRSSWNFVPLRYRVEPAVLEGLRAEGCEIGVHGLRHDGRDLASRRTIATRVPQMRRYAERWGAVGFRSPATQRRWEWMPQLGFAYDSSYPDTDPYEPQPGGCCSWWPFQHDSLVELPITLPQDHTLFAILGHHDGRAWVDKTARIEARGGMALALTHPDYVDDGPAVRAYRQLLEAYAGHPSVWHALPAEVAEWWRRRAGSHLEGRDGEWEVRGPAAGEARVQLAWPAESDRVPSEGGR